MALLHFDTTLGAAATQITTVRHGVRQLIIQNPAGNDVVYVGQSTVSASTYGQVLAADSASSVIGPFSGDAPVNITEVYLFGTQDNVVHCLLITH